jgi:hypothetical protein
LSASEFERASAPQGEAAALYRQALLEVAEHQVVDEAEDVLNRSWIGVLDGMRRAALGLAASAQGGQLRDAREFLASVDAELELVCEAAVERARRDRLDGYRLRKAWRAAYCPDGETRDAG